MARRTLALGVLLLTLNAFVRSSPQDLPTFQSRVQLIEIDVRVTDSRGRDITGLTKDDFVLLEDGVPQTISTASFIDLSATSPISRMAANSVEQDTFSNAGDGRMWVMLLGGFSKSGPLVSRRVARQFIENALGPHDEVAVVSVLGTMSSAQGFTRSRQRMLRAVDRLQDDRAGAVGDPILLTYGMIEQLASRLGLMGGRRKSIIFFDPPPFFAPEGPRDGDRSDAARLFAQRDAIRAATRNNVAIHVVSTDGLTTELTAPLGPGVRFDPLKAMAGMRLLAEETGGEAIVNSNNYAEGFVRLVRDTSAYYLLGYTPAVDHQDGEFHDVTVSVRRSGLVVRARRGYYAAGPVPPSQLVRSATGTSSQLQEVLRLPLSVNGISMDVFAAPFQHERTASILIGARLDTQEMSLDPGAPLEIGYRAITNDGVITPGTVKSVTLNLSTSTRAAADMGGIYYIDRMSLPPGRHQLRFAVHQPDGKSGMVVSDVELPNFSREPLSLSGIVVSSNHLSAQPTISNDLRIRTVLGGTPTPARSFRRDDVLRAYIEAYTPTDAKSGAVTLRATVAPASNVRQLRQLASNIVATEAGITGYVIPLNLSELAVGDFVLTIEARVGRRQATRQFAFSITPSR